MLLFIEIDYIILNVYNIDFMNIYYSDFINRLHWFKNVYYLDKIYTYIAYNFLF